MYTYEVTVTPKHKSYAGNWSSGEYTVEVYAASAAEAIKRARRNYSDENGRGNPATFRAKKMKESEE